MYLCINKCTGILVFTILVVMAPFCFANQIKNDIPEIPGICTFDCTVGFTAIDSTYPGKDTVVIPITITVQADTVVDYLWVKLTLATGLTYVGYSDNDGSGTFSTDGSGNRDVSFQWSSTNISGSSQHLIDLMVCVADSVNFSNSKSITHTTGFPIASSTTNPNNQQISGTTGYVKIISGRCWLWADTTTAYSWQRRDYASDAEKNDTIFVPLKFKASFPVDSLRFGFKRSDSLNIGNYLGFIQGPSTTDSLTGFSNYQAIFDNHTYYPPNTVALLGHLIFSGADYGSGYSGNYNFSKFDSVYFYDSQNRIHCASSTRALTWSDMTKTTGGVKYPVYSCTTLVGSDSVTYDSRNVSLPVRAKHTFPSQTYEYYFSFNNRCVKFDNVTTPAGDDVQSALADSQGTSGTITTWRVQSSPAVQSGKHVGVNSNEILFNLNFVATDSFSIYGDTTSVWINTSGDNNFVDDYYHASGDKIRRADSSTTYFKVYPGKIIFSGIFAVQIDSVACDSTTEIYIPIRLLRATANSASSLDMDISFPDTQYFAMAEWSFGEDFEIESVNTLVNTPTRRRVIIHFDSGTLVGSGVIGKIRCRTSRPAANGFAKFEWNSAVYGPFGKLPVYYISANPQINGGIESCTGTPRLDAEYLPFDYSLAQNYPNPFNGRTNIAFSCPIGGHVRIEIFDILGRKVRDLVDGDYSPGQYVVTWDGKNGTGEPAATGIYLYKIDSEGFTDVKRMLYLK